MAMGTISGSAAKYPDVAVVWVDAHAVGNKLRKSPEISKTCAKG